MTAGADLGQRLGALGFRLVHLSETGSTNELAGQLAAEGAPAGLVVLADSQTAGRGRQGRSWVSTSGCGLFVSFLRRPAFPARDAWLWTLLAGVALQSAVGEVTAGSWLKWPNDLFRAERKLGGILCELQVAPNHQVDSLVVGVGLNLFSPPSGWPEGLRSPAGVVWPETPVPKDFVARDDLLVRLAQGLLLLEVDLGGTGREALLMRYRAAMAPMLGRRISIEVPEGEIDVMVEGVSDKGALQVVDGKGQRRSLLAGDVHLHEQGAI